MIRAGGVLLALTFGALPTLWVAAETTAFALGTSLVPSLEGLTGPLCHHDPARTLLVAERPLPVCARCTGLYAGAAAGGLLGAVVPRKPLAIRRAALAAGWGVALGLLAAILEALGLLSTSNTVRLVLGLLLGAGVPLLGTLGGRIIATIR